MDSVVFSFDNVPSRRGTNSYKWDVHTNGEDYLPLWVADMDFPVAPCVQNALQKRVNHPIFGYVAPPELFYQATIDWFTRRHGWKISKEWIIYTSGVVPAISAIIKAVTKPGNKVLVQTPVYNCFFSSIRNNGCEVVENPLLWDGDTYHIDYEDFEKKVSDSQVKVFLLCNPHNPAGRVWTKEELYRLGNLCKHYGVFVISDEIHCELVMPGFSYTPFASISDEFLPISATCISPSKSFNTAGLQIANIVVPDTEIYKKVDKAININEVCDVNPFGVEALIAAYTEGESWLEALNQYLWENYQYLLAFFKQNLPMFPVAKLEGTYLVWVDCSILNKSSEVICNELLQRVHLHLNEGSIYQTTPSSFVRINIACPRATLAEALNRVYKVWGKISVK